MTPPRSALRFLALAVWCVGTTAPASHAALDPTFAGDGIASTPIGTSSGASALVLQPDDRIVAAGFTTVGSNAVALVRYLANGGLDSSFGVGGVVTTAIGASASAAALVVQGDGKLIVAGRTSDGSSDSILVMRYEADGSLDAGFGVGGIVITTLALTATANAALLQPDGRIVVAGTMGSAGTDDLVVLRYDTDGTLDATFDDDGIVVTDLSPPGRDLGTAMALQADGNIVVGGARAPSSGGFKLAMARYTPSGTLDTTFGTGGVVITAYDGFDAALIVQPDQKIVLGGGSVGFVVARYLTDGAPDTTFANNGAFVSGAGVVFPVLLALAHQAPDRILLGGGMVTVVSLHPPVFTSNAFLGRLVNDGNTIDINAAFDLGNSSDSLAAVAAQPDGGLLGVGGPDGVFTTIRYTLAVCSDGTVGGSEQCDDGNLTDDDGCDHNCTPTGCGNFVVTTGETCDDGNAGSGDCCSPSCQLESAGTACASDGNLCTDDVCTSGGSCSHPANTAPCDDGDGCTLGDTCSLGQCAATPLTCPLCERCDPAAGACVDRPQTSCLPVLFEASASLQLIDKASDKSDRLQWKRRHAFDTGSAAFGDPVATHDYALCLYDESGSTPALLTRFRTRRGLCDTAPCWKPATRGFKFHDKLQTPDGLDSVVLKGSLYSPSSIIVKGRGATLPLPTLPLPLPARVQLQATNGQCWEATYSASSAQRNDAGQFKGTND